MIVRTAALAAFLFLLGCGPTAQPACRTDADCGGQTCTLDGRCVEAADGGDTDGGLHPGGDGGAGDGGALPGCLPDHDGVIERGEVLLAAGLSANFRVASGVELSTAGALEDGVRTWDLNLGLEGDHDALVSLASPDGAWWEDAFPGATYAGRLRDASELLGVFEATGEALLLRGVVSEAGGALRTELTYDPPVTVLSFPLSADRSWRTDATVTGVASGMWVAYTEVYESRVDAAGRLHAPYGTFPVQRVRTEVTRTVGLVTTPLRSFLFQAECFGTVASIASEDGEDGAEFTRAAEVRRLSR